MSASGKVTLLMVLWLLWIAGVIVGELLPPSSAPILFLASTHVSDKLLHYTAYLGIALMPALAFGSWRGAAAGGFAIALGVALEFAQRLVPGRAYEVADMFTNAAGVLTGFLLGLAIRAMAPSPLPAKR